MEAFNAAYRLAPIRDEPGAAAFAEAGPLTFLERNSDLQRDPETGAYLNPELAAMAEQLMRSE